MERFGLSLGLQENRLFFDTFTRRDEGKHARAQLFEDPRRLFGGGGHAAFAAAKTHTSRLGADPQRFGGQVEVGEILLDEAVDLLVGKKHTTDPPGEMTVVYPNI